MRNIAASFDAIAQMAVANVDPNLRKYGQATVDHLRAIDEAFRALPVFDIISTEQALRAQAEDGV